LFRLYTVLGRRTGHEPQPDNRTLAPTPLRDVRAVQSVEPPPAEGACARGLLDIEMADPSFDRDHFLKGARSAYEIIQNAYAEADRLTLRPLLSDEVYAAFEREITARPGAQPRLAKINDARIVGAELTGKLADITVAFRAGFEGPDGTVREVADHWSFARTIGAAGPNWTLVATAGEPS
ncbi:MAG TPA: Tim44/TimA family putative adaptor protein, partial [Rhizomicrobium sp.]|nr:Tim44/TimA family putative adaptor protein [Rhizomicrobium sp.]